MPSVDELARDLLASADSSAGAPLAARWINNRYQEMVSKIKFRHLRQVGELSMPAVVSAGLISVARGSTTVTPDATAQAAWLVSPGVAALEHWFLRTRNNWHKVASVDVAAATITLETAFAETSVTLGGYRLVKRYHSLASDARWIGEFAFPRLRREIETLSLTELDIKYPGRELAGHLPATAAQIGVDSTGKLLYEIYPPPTETELINYVYWSLPSALTLASTIPQVIDTYTLKEGALVDLYRFEKLAQIRAGNIEAAAVLANEEAKQRLVWQKAIKDAIRTSRGSDDITFILQMFRGASRQGSHDQRTASDYVRDNWRR